MELSERAVQNRPYPDSEENREALGLLGMTVVETRAGWIGLIASAQGLVELLFPEDSEAAAWEALRARLPSGTPLPDTAWAEVKDQLRRYFAGEIVHFSVPFDLGAYTPFQCAVWQVACQIPYGQTRSYSWVAAEIGAPKAYRAVGSALAANPIPIIIPCHRVLRSDGSLGGYGGGLAMKQRLLALERGVAINSIRQLG